MKRLLPLFLIALILFSSCGAWVPQTAPGTEPAAPAASSEAETPATAGTLETLETTETATAEPPALPALPALYYFKEGGALTYEKITSYSAVPQKDADVGSFGVAPEVEPDGKKSYVSLWNKGLADYPALADFKTGYTLVFETTAGQVFTVELFRPSDTKGDFNEYLDVYLYDDVANAGKGWYSHMEESDFSAASLITSVKLTGRARASEIARVSLSVFLYDASGARTEPLTLSF